MLDLLRSSLIDRNSFAYNRRAPYNDREHRPVIQFGPVASREVAATALYHNGNRR